MKPARWVVLSLVLLPGLSYAQEKPALKTQKEKASYTIGVDIGQSLKNQGIKVDANLLARGIRDGLSGGKLLLSDQELKATQEILQKEIMAMQQEQLKKIAAKNKEEGEAFLAANKKKEGVVSLPSGLQYRVLKGGNGSGKKPQLKDTVTTHYRGTLINGTEFDSSYRRGQPASFPVNRVIPGWTEALQLMEEGSKWQLSIPSALAYGERGAGPQIGPNATLVFEIELISIQKAP